jgi:integrase
MSPIPLDRFAAGLVAIDSTGRHAPATAARMRQLLNEVAALPGVATTADLTTATVARWVATRGPGANPNTINGYLDHLRAACSYAVEEGYLDRPPNWSRVRPRRRPMSKNPPLSVAEVARLLEHLERFAGTWEGHRLFALVATVASTGLRRDEALRLLVADLDLRGRTLAVVERSRRLKTAGSARVVGLPDLLSRALAAWVVRLDGLPWLFPGVRLRGPWVGGMAGARAIDHLRRAAREAGIATPATWHGLRHSFGTHAVGHFGVPLWAVQRTMGHASIRTTERYLHLDDPAALAEAVRALAYRDSA